MGNRSSLYNTNPRCVFAFLDGFGDIRSWSMKQIVAMTHFSCVSHFMCCALNILTYFHNLSTVEECGVYDSPLVYMNGLSVTIDAAQRLMQVFMQLTVKLFFGMERVHDEGLSYNSWLLVIALLACSQSVHCWTNILTSYMNGLLALQHWTCLYTFYFCGYVAD